MAEAGDWKSVLRLQTACKAEQFFKPSARHHHVFVQLGQSRVAQCIGKLTAQLPNSFASFGSERLMHETRFRAMQQPCEILDFCSYRALLTVDFHYQMRV